MSDEYDKIQEMMQQHEDFASGKSSELKKSRNLIKDLILSTIIGFAAIFIFGSLFALIFGGDWRNAIYGAAAIIAGVSIAWIAFSFTVASLNFNAEMTRRAWTNRPQNQDAYRDFRNMWEWGSNFLYGFIISGITVVLVFYYGLV